MNNTKQIIQRLQLRNKLLSQSLLNLKADLEMVYEKNLLEAGVINPGYFSHFLPVLEDYRNANQIIRYHISEEQYTNSYTGELLKIPVIDVSIPEDTTASKRIFILPNSLLLYNKI
jgi:hypothetical protein